jgi:hypothetical protein
MRERLDTAMVLTCTGEGNHDDIGLFGQFRF